MTARRAVMLGVVVAVAGCSGAPEEEIDLHPFETLLSVELGDGPEEFELRRLVESGDAVARCMQAKGFEYHPGPVVDVEDESPEQLEEQMRARGWGMFSLGDGPDEWVDPELDEQGRYMASLSPSAYEEYHRALFGERDSETGQYLGVSGCFTENSGEVDEDAPDVRFADLIDEVRSAGARASEEPEVIKARDAYRTCLALAGFPGGDAGELLELRFAEEFPSGQISGSDPRLPELVTWEVSLANVHFDCLEETGSGEISARAIARVQAQILERRAEEVAAYVQAAKEYYEVD